MNGWFDSGIGPIGIDAGLQNVKVVQLRRKRAQFELQAGACVELSANARENPEVRAAETAAVLSKVLRGGPFKGKSCVSALPPEMVQTKSVRLPQMPQEEVEQAVQWEAKDRFGFDLSDAGFAYFKAGEVRRGTEVRDEYLLFAAPGEVMQGHVKMLTDLGLEIEGIDLQPCAMIRSTWRNSAGAPGIATCLIDLGASGTQISICQDGRLGFYKHVDIGGRHLDKAVAEKLGVPRAEAEQIRMRVFRHLAEDEASAPLEQAVLDAVRPAAEELAKELDMCLRYYVVTFRASRPEAVTLVGGNSYAEPVVKAIAATLGMRTERAHPMRGVGLLQDVIRPDRSSEWAVAAGLSLYDVAYAKLGEVPL